MHSTKLILFTLLVALACGCALNQNAAMERRATTQQNKEFDRNRISFVDNMDVLVVETRTRWQGPFLNVMFELMNRDSANTTHPVYQIEWLDKNGFPKAVTAWKPLMIKGNQTVKVTETSPVQEAVDYKLIISNKEK